MKRLLPTALLLLATIACYAQKFDVVVCGGGGYNSGIRYADGISPSLLYIEPVGELKVMYNYKHWQLGAAAGLRMAAYRIRQEFIPADGFGYIPKFVSTMYYPVRLFINRKMTFGRFDVYGGLSTGYLSIADGDGKYFTSHAFMFRNNGFYGISAGAQAGGTYFLSKHIGINAELSTDFVRFHQAELRSRMQVYSFTIGIRFRF